jgi:hypothetical protein
VQDTQFDLRGALSDFMHSTEFSESIKQRFVADRIKNFGHVYDDAQIANVRI